MKPEQKMSVIGFFFLGGGGLIQPDALQPPVLSVNVTVVIAVCRGEGKPLLSTTPSSLRSIDPPSRFTCVHEYHREIYTTSLKRRSEFFFC